MIEQVVQAIADQIESTPDLLIKMNLSAASILDPELAGRIETIVENNAIGKNHLLFEFNEEATVTHLKQSIELFKMLDYEEYQIAIGDYGSTLKSSELLESLKVPSLKWLSIDHTLMKEFTTNTKAQAEIAELLQFAHDHEYTTIVPEVADAGSLALIWPMNADHIHGNYIAHPDLELDFDFAENQFF